MFLMNCVVVFVVYQMCLIDSQRACDIKVSVSSLNCFKLLKKHWINNKNGEESKKIKETDIS